MDDFLSILPLSTGGYFHLFARIAVGLLALALVYATAIPLVRSDAWWIRIFDFPRLQILVVIGVTLIGYVALRYGAPLRVWDYVLASTLVLALLWQLISIAPYTTLYPKQMIDSRAQGEGNRLSLLTYNVLHDNDNVDGLLDLIQDTNPDLILLCEITPRWLEQLDGLQDSYPYTIFQPQENDYGMLLYSRLQLVDPEIRFLIEPGIPSIRSQIRLNSGSLVTLYGVHPRPPGLKRADDEEAVSDADDEDGEREDTDMRDAELMMVAQELQDLGDHPVIVAGDLNDVAWSHTTRLFQRIGGLLDPRVGRGIFNTFSTKSRIFRYPLDHVFASPHFTLVELRRLPDIGSDHFPLLVVLDYDPHLAAVHEAPQADSGDQQEAENAIQKERSP